MLFCILLLLTGCAAAPSSTSGNTAPYYNTPPCWLHQPYSDQAQGVIAITSQYGGGDLLALSRLQALQALAELFDLQLPDDVDLQAEHFMLSGQWVKLAPSWSQDGQHYSYAYFSTPQADRWVLRSCIPTSCAPQACSPSWLCQDSSRHLSIVTVSQLAAHQREQYRLLFANALMQYQALHGVTIHAERTQLHHRSLSGIRVASTLREIETTRFDFAQLQFEWPLVLTHSCLIDTTLYGRFELLGQLAEGTPKRTYPANWHQSQRLDEGLAIGYFSGFLSRNLISLKIEEAINHALLALARNQQTHIEFDELQIQRGSDGFYSVSFVHETTHGHLKARVRSLRFVGNAQHPEIFVLIEQVVP